MVELVVEGIEVGEVLLHRRRRTGFVNVDGGIRSEVIKGVSFGRFERCRGIAVLGIASHAVRFLVKVRIEPHVAVLVLVGVDIALKLDIGIGEGRRRFIFQAHAVEHANRVGLVGRERLTSFGRVNLVGAQRDEGGRYFDRDDVARCHIVAVLDFHDEIGHVPFCVVGVTGFDRALEMIGSYFTVGARCGVGEGLIRIHYRHVGWVDLHVSTQLIGKRKVSAMRRIAALNSRGQSRTRANLLENVLEDAVQIVSVVGGLVVAGIRDPIAPRNSKIPVLEETAVVALRRCIRIIARNSVHVAVVIVCSVRVGTLHHTD